MVVTQLSHTCTVTCSCKPPPLSAIQEKRGHAAFEDSQLGVLVCDLQTGLRVA